jgi:hypothetical protein
MNGVASNRQRYVATYPEFRGLKQRTSLFLLIHDSPDTEAEQKQLRGVMAHCLELEWPNPSQSNGIISVVYTLDLKLKTVLRL